MAGDLQAVNRAMCDFCEERPAFLYCRPDSAKLCLPCDHHVHAANPLSLKHSRSPLCECCGEGSAALQCEEEAKFFCAKCEESAHNGEGHTLIKASTFSGRVAPNQLASAWKCHAPNLAPDNFLLSRGAALDNLCWSLDGPLGSILASPWTNSVDAFMLSGGNPDFADIWSSPDSLLEGDVYNKEFAEQLGQLHKRQLEGDDCGAGLLQEPMVPSHGLGDLPVISNKRQYQQEVPVQPVFNIANSFPYTGPSQNEGCRNGTFEREVSLVAKKAPAEDIFKNADRALMHPVIEKSKQHRWLVPPSATSIVSMERASILKNKEQSLPSAQAHSHLMDSSWPHASENAGDMETGMHDCPSISKSSPKEATECHPFNEETSTLSMKLSSPELENQAEHGRNSSSLNKDLSSTDHFIFPTKLDSAAVAQARGSAMMRYKEKRKTRNFEKFVRYESRKARAETRLRVRGRFVRANGFHSESLFADKIN